MKTRGGIEDAMIDNRNRGYKEKHILDQELILETLLDIRELLLEHQKSEFKEPIILHGTGGYNPDYVKTCGTCGARTNNIGHFCAGVKGGMSGKIQPQ